MFALNEADGYPKPLLGKCKIDQKPVWNCLIYVERGGIVRAGVPVPSGAVPVAAAMQRQVSGL